MVRLFVSVEIPAAVKQRLERLCCDVPGARWADPEQIHLTLRFIGEVDELVFGDVEAALGQVRAAPFDLELKGVGHFPPRGEPKVLWVGVERSEGLSQLHDRVERALVRAGVEPERRRFSPHVTLARLNHTPSRVVASYLAMNGLLRCGPFPVGEFHLFSSSLSAKRAVHRCEASYPLLAGGSGLTAGGDAGRAEER
jgi:RNA 2',3'-cyclic 3'-phosphodiesterase